MKIHKLTYILLTLFFINQPSFADSFFANDLRSLFLSSRANIYAINIRTFNADDKNGNDIVEAEFGEERGTFLNAAQRLDEIKELGINTIYLLPITKVGKLKAIGTAGSLYAMDSFYKINPQLDDENDIREVEDEAKYFVSQAHKRNIRVIVDMPSCGSYDMSLEYLNLFARDKNDETITPSDWTDIRLFKVYENKKLNYELLANYKKFIDMVQKIGVDGIRADVAAIKPYEFWKNLIDYARMGDSQFLFIAEASPAFKNPVKSQNFYTSINSLLDSGFDGYYGEYMNFNEITRASDFYKQLKTEQKILKKFDNKKAVLASFATHDVQSPALSGTKNKSETITWLSITLPHLNPYFLDGFSTGDTFTYKYENKKADCSYTDDDYYFTHKGKADIFNFSRKPQGAMIEIKEDIKRALEFKNWAYDVLSHGNFKTMDVKNKKVIAYKRNYKKDSVVVLSNLDSATVQINFKIKKDAILIPVKSTSSVNKNGKIVVGLTPFETAVFMVSEK